MFKLFTKKRKIITAAMSAMFVATAFTAPGGCTITLDEELLQQVLGWVEGFSDGPGCGPGVLSLGYDEPEYGSCDLGCATSGPVYGPDEPYDDYNPCWGGRNDELDQ
ncbi:MAG: hypothetical protein JXQ75_00765 [Phycisphaerae bacterium]|nr:hypothetical protein [Phycisphaerae bacterium]